MAELPAWIQEAKDRAEAASKGPWHVVHCEDRDFATMLRVSTVPDSEEPGDTVAVVVLQMPLEACVSDERWDENGEFIADARTDVPRLIDAVAEITDALEAAITEVQRRCPRLCDYGGKYMPSGISDNDVCAKCRTAECRIPDVISVYRKYRGEVGMNDETIQG